MQDKDSQFTHMPINHQKMGSSSRILYDIPCKVCRDHSSGKHYGIFACDGCAGFFKRSIRRNRQYVCKAKSEGGCMVDKTHRNQCRACRLAKCIQAGMNKDAVQHERGPRNSTLRRQMALYFKEPEMVNTIVPPPTNAALDLVMPKSSAEQRATMQVATVAAPPPPPPVYHHHHQHHMPVPHPFYCNVALAKLYRMSQMPIAMGPVPGMVVPMPSVTPHDSICEHAARLLFMNVNWMRDMSATTCLSLEDQLTLLECSWRELFLLAAAQMMPNLDPTPLISPDSRNIALAVEVSRFRDTVAGFHSLNLDQHEFACVRAIVLFKAGLESEPIPSSGSSSGSNSPGGLSRLRDPATVARLRDSAQLTLGHRLSTTPFGALRFGKLLLLLPTLKSVSPSTIEELFFRRTIGIIPIERIICDMYKSG